MPIRETTILSTTQDLVQACLQFSVLWSVISTGMNREIALGLKWISKHMVSTILPLGATDEKPFLDYMKAIFPNQILHIQALRYKAKGLSILEV